jgi:exodeoxyribonuclease VII large subunit
LPEEVREYTPSQLNREIKDLLQTGLGRIWIAGEISNLRKPASGHYYFTLKDEKSQVRAVFFRHHYLRNRQAGLRDASSLLAEGRFVSCLGQVTVYEERGEYQILVEWMENRGEGALRRAFDQLKAKLEAEGLFAGSHKKAIPFLPRAVGLVTSPTGSVIRDMLQIMQRRFPSMPVYVSPTKVQGAGAAEEIVRALELLQKVAEVEVIILARGGGSLEDLAPFNEEKLARAVFACPVPLIAAVGHETDFTIADFVADLRAPTPSAAAELVVPVRREMEERVLDCRRRLVNALMRELGRQGRMLKLARGRLMDPRRIMAEKRLAIDDRLERLTSFLSQALAGRRKDTKRWERTLMSFSPLAGIAQKRKTLAGKGEDLGEAMKTFLGRRRTLLLAQAALLDSVNPLSVLSRGYSITLKPESREIIRDARVLQGRQAVEVLLFKGKFTALVEKTFIEG